jgi:hypothetical protein
MLGLLVLSNKGKELGSARSKNEKDKSVFATEL